MALLWFLLGAFTFAVLVILALFLAMFYVAPEIIGDD